LRILFLTQWFQPEPFFKGLPFAEKLKAQGHEVEVLTGFPNYPGGKLYPGYRVRLFRREIMQGIPINRVALFPSHDRSGVKRILTYLSFSLSALLLGPLLVKRPDVVYVYNLITLSWAAVLLRKISGCKIVYDVQDLWPESVSNSGMLNHRMIQGVLKRWCCWAYRQADKVAVLSPGFKEALIERGVARERIEVIYNWCDEASGWKKEKSVDFREKFALTETFNIVFAGTMGRMQGMDTVLAAASLSRNELPVLRFVLVGGGVELERLKSKAASLMLENVVFIPMQPLQEMNRIWSIADALLVHLIDNPLFRITIPSKTQAYLAAGIPIIMAVRGDAAGLIQQAGAGIGCAPEDPGELLSAIQKLFAMTIEERKRMGEKGKLFYNRFLSFDVGYHKFLKLFS
jgi:glycosyltransferase involved in cell wall biosynthesis